MNLTKPLVPYDLCLGNIGIPISHLLTMHKPV